MFLFGLILGPALGLLAGDFIARPEVGNPRFSAAAAAVIVLVVLFLPFVDLGLRAGLVTGFLLGILLWFTPQVLVPAE